MEMTVKGMSYWTDYYH